jgi:hypothetical protein
MLVVCRDCGRAAQVNSKFKDRKRFTCKKCGGEGQITLPPEPIGQVTPNVIPLGRCKKCGIEIARERLLANPDARFCADHEPHVTKVVNTWVPRGVKIPTGYG